MKGKKLLGVVGASALGFGGVAGFWFYTQNQFEHEDTSRLLIPERDYTDKEAEKRFKSRYTFVLDMDETLLHTSFKTDTEGKVAVRQFAGDLLTSTAELGEMVLWTAGTEGYARLALKLLGPQTELFHERIFRNRLWWGEMMQNTKRLVMLNRDPDYTLIVDNHAYVVDVEDANNAIIVSDFIDDENDAELRDVAVLLKELHKSGMKVPEFLNQKADEGRLQRLPSGHLHMYPSASRPGSSQGWFGLW